MLKLRIITALCLVPVVLAAMFLLPLTYFSLFAGGVFVLAAFEWGRFIDAERSSIFMVSLALVLFGLMGVIPIEHLWSAEAGPATLANGLLKYAAWLLSAGAVWWVIALGLVVSFPRSQRLWKDNPGAKAMCALFSLVPFYFALLALRSYQYEQDPYYGAWLLLFVMSLVWVADTGAYFAGKAFGKRKLCPNVSPGKTLEGMLGGVVAATVLAVIVTQSVNLAPGHSQVLLIASVVAVLASVLGDLTESMFKREAGLKDSGNILPGHGGIMDRIDSLTAALPVFVVVVWLLG
ncbi:MAG: phosphatidate cytidylyltransferase [Oceanisphaera sp.]